MSLFFAEKRAAPTAADLVQATRLLRANSAATPNVDALEVAAVVACVGLRAGAFAQLPLKGYRDRADGTSELLSVQPEFLRSPSDVVVPSVWKTQMSISRDVFGFALGRITAFDGAFYPKRTEWIDPSIVMPKMVGAAIEWRVGREVIDPSLLVHVPSRWVPPGYPVGISPLEYSGLVELAKRAQDFGRDWFRNGAVPSSIIYSDKELTGSEADSIVETVLSKWRSRRPAVLGSGLKHEQVSVNANESQFLETITHIAAEIATSFNLPPSKIGAAIAGQNVTYSNRDQDQLSYLVDSINPDLVVIQESLDRHSPRGQYCRFNTGAFLRSDLKTRYESYKVGIEGKFITPNEARMWEELAPLDGGDEFPAPPPMAPPVAPPAEEPRSLHVHVDARQEPPVVNVAPTEVTVSPAAISVDARHTTEVAPTAVSVFVPEQPAPVVNVAPAEVRIETPAPAVATRKRIEHTPDGRIAAIIEEPA